MSDNDSVPSKKGEINPKRLTKKQYDIANDIGSNIKCAVDKKTKVITISATAQDPYISTILADSAKEKLQYYITQYRTNKARNDVKYMEKLFTDAKADYDKARQRYASYSDANQDLQLATFRMKQEDLENEMQLKYNIYTQVASQLQLSRTKLQERTPAFTVIQSATMPFKHSNKSKLSILLTALFLAVFIRMSYLAIKNYKKIIHLNID
jgi:capsule polysaccharide export protein KpsE/RkpR